MDGFNFKLKLKATSKNSLLWGTMGEKAKAKEELGRAILYTYGKYISLTLLFNCACISIFIYVLDR